MKSSPSQRERSNEVIGQSSSTIFNKIVRVHYFRISQLIECPYGQMQQTMLTQASSSTNTSQSLPSPSPLDKSQRRSVTPSTPSGAHYLNPLLGPPRQNLGVRIIQTTILDPHLRLNRLNHPSSRKLLISLTRLPRRRLTRLEPMCMT